MNSTYSPHALARTAGPLGLLIVSDWCLGPTLAAEFDSTDDVTLVAPDELMAARAPDHTATVVGDLTMSSTLERAGADAVDTAAVGVRTDSATLLVAQLLRTRFGVETTIVVGQDPTRHDAISDIATAVVSGPECLASALQRELTPAATGSADR
jgi:Trk K+ transport system NAD-binding subunit